MSKRIFYSKQVKTVMALVVTMSLLVLALPCNCMAMENPKPVEKQPPCHSSSDQSNTDSPEHKNCCCDGSDYSLVSEVGVTTLKTTEVTPEESTFYITYVFARFLNQWFASSDSIRGSPPTHDILTISSSTFLALFQRWLI